MMSVERWIYQVSLRLRSLFRAADVDRELDDELRYHVDRLVEASIARGTPPAEARRQALLALGGIERRKEECRDVRGIRLLEDLLQDLRYAARMLRRLPAFTLAAVGTLALGIGSTVAVFTVINGVLLRPLPFPDPDRLFYITLAMPTPFRQQPSMADGHYVEFRSADRFFQHLAAFSSRKANLTGAGEPIVIKVGAATTEFFSALGVQPALGRAFQPDDGQKGREPIVVLSDRLWRARFGADPAIVGKTATLDGISRLIVGVMPEGFEFPETTDAWAPHVMVLDRGNSLMWPVLGRLKPDVTIDQARSQFDGIARRLLSDVPEAERATWLTGILPLKGWLVGDARRPLAIFAGAVAFVLLIACANVANLLLARASGRQREISTRAALGASRLRLVRQMLTESTLVSVAGGLQGVVLAGWLVPALLALAPAGRIPRSEMIRLDLAVLGFALGISLMTALLFGIVPALRIARHHGDGPIVGSERVSPAGQERLRAALVVAEIALALVLLTGAALMLRSFLRLRAVDPGFNPENVVTLNLELPGSVYSSPERFHIFQREMLDRLVALPDVVAAGAVNWRPLGDMLIKGDFAIEGMAEPTINVDKPAVSPGYFRAMGIRVVRGREFQHSDTAAALGVAIVSRSVARLIDASEDVIGRRVRMWGRGDWLTIVGVVDDVKQGGPADAAHPALYQPYAQARQPFFLSHLSFVVRTTGDPLRLVPAIRAVLRTVDQNQPATSIALMKDVMSASTAEPRFLARLLSTFALLAVALAFVGTYGVLSYSVAQRTHEIGLRMALGARRRAVVWMVVRRTMLLSITGVALGTLGAWFTTHFLSKFLFQTTATEPTTFSAVAILIFASALIAGLVPARRATRVDPLVALRHE